LQTEPSTRNAYENLPTKNRKNEELMHRKKRGGKKAGTGAVQVMNTGRRRSVVEWGARTHDSNSARQAAHADFHVVAKEARVKHATDNWNNASRAAEHPGRSN
jgi:hypothetical protein